MWERLLSGIDWNLDIGRYLLDIAVVAAIGFAMTWFYMYYAEDIAGKRRFSRTILPIILGMMFYSSVIAASASMALAAVGALSIIRYRAIVNQVEVLIFIFMALGIGIAAGTGQIAVAVVSAFCFMILLAIQKIISSQSFGKHLLTLKTTGEKSGAVLDAIRNSVPGFIVREVIAEPGQESWMIDIVAKKEENLIRLKTLLLRADHNISFTVEDVSGEE